MGYSFHCGTSGASKKNMVAFLTAPYEFKKKDGSIVKFNCLESSVRNGNHLWMAMERTETTLEGVEKKECYIVVNLLKSSQGDWGYKTIDEFSHPYYYDCPLSFLSLVPYNEALGDKNSKEWRDGVLAYAEKNKEIAKNKKKLEVGMKIILPKAQLKNYEIVDLTNMKRIIVRCLDNGMDYNLRPKHLKELEIVQ